MEEAKKSRRIARTWVSKVINRLDRSLSEHSPDINSIQLLLSELDQRVNNLNFAQEKVEILLEDEELEKDIEAADSYLDSTREAKVRANRFLAEYHAQSQVNDANVNENVPRQKDANNQSPAQLPKIEMKKFSGQYEEWQEFWDRFSAIIDQSNMATINKFTYLQSLLEDEALTTIKGLSLTENNYEIATSLLKDRFGRKERIVFAHIQRLLNIEVKNVHSTSRLWQIYNELQTNIRCLENFGVDGEQYGVVLTPIVLNRLPQEFRLEWARKSVGKEGDLSWLMDFLKDEISLRERSETYQKDRQPEDRRDHHTRKPSAAVLQNKECSKKETFCAFCSKRHVSSKCWNLKKMHPEEVKDILRRKKLCFRCFRSGHVAKQCTVRCELCTENHNKFFCSKTGKETIEQTRTTRSGGSSVPESDCVDHSRSDKNNYHHSKFTNKMTVMQTVSVTINGTHCTVLFDSGSDKSYITSSCVKRVRPKYIGHEHVSYTCFGEKRPRHPTRRNVFEIDYKSAKGDKKFVVTEIPIITAPMYREKIPEGFLKEFEDAGLVSLKNEYTKDENVVVDILIGLDAYWNLMSPNVITTSHGLVAQESIFGWLLCGSYPLQGRENLKPVAQRQNLCLTDLSDSLIRSFWELEHMGIQAVEKSQNQDLQKFNQNIHFVDGRFEVDLPWKEDKKLMLENNYEQARSRLNKLEKRLEADPDLKERYHTVLNDLESEGIFEEVLPEQMHTEEHPVFYLPHRPVLKESSETTKVRPVFDASAAGPNGVSLNSCMETGPN